MGDLLRPCSRISVRDRLSPGRVLPHDPAGDPVDRPPRLVLRRTHQTPLRPDSPRWGDGPADGPGAGPADAGAWATELSSLISAITARAACAAAPSSSRSFWLNAIRLASVFSK